MKKVHFLLAVMLCLMLQSLSAQKLEKGISKALAEQRKEMISNVKYDLTFNIPAELKKPKLYLHSVGNGNSR